MNEASHVQNPPTKFKRFRHLVFLAILYALVLCASFPLIDWTRGQSLSYVWPFLVALILLTSIWSVLGPGSYHKRMLWTHAVCLPAVIVGAVVLYVSMLQLESFSLTYVIKLTALLTPVFTIAAQIPLWFFRGALGWRIAFCDEEAVTTLSLKEIFVITLVFGFACAVPRMAERLIVNETVNAIVVGSETIALATPPDGAIYYESVMVTADNVAELKEKAKSESSDRFLAFIGGYALASAVFSLLSVYLIWVSLGFNRSKALTRLVILGVVLFLVGAVIFTAVFDFKYFIFQVAFMLGLNVAMVIGAISLPMLLSRHRGFHLETNKSKRMKPEANQGKDKSDLPAQHKLDALGFEAFEPEKPEALPTRTE